MPDPCAKNRPRAWGSSWGAQEAPNTVKTNGFLTFLLFAFLAFQTSFGALLDHLGSLLGPSWRPLAPIWAPQGVPLGPLGVPWPPLEPSWVLLTLS